MDEQLRIGDAERERAAAELADHYTEGRLTTEEHAERLDRVWAARTRSDLLPIFRDLPSPYAAVASAPSVGPDDRYWNAGMRRFRRGVPAPLLVVLAVLIVLSAIAHFPFLLLGFAVFWFVVLRHRGPRRAYAAERFGRHPRHARGCCAPVYPKTRCCCTVQKHASIARNFLGVKIGVW